MIRKKVRIKDAYKRDVGKGIIRIDPQVIADMSLKTGDVIEISHPAIEKKTAAILYPGKGKDLGTNTIRIDLSLRRNIGALINGKVEIRKVIAVLADKIIFAGLDESVEIRKPNLLVRMLFNQIITKDDIFGFKAMGRLIEFIVINHLPQADAVRVHLDTEVSIMKQTYKEISALEKRRKTYEDIGGLSDEIQQLREIVELPSRHPELFKRMGVDPPKSVLLYGLPGTGKTSLIRAVAHESKAYFITVRSPEITSKFQGETEANLREVFKEARKNSPSIIYFDKLDVFFPHSEDNSSSESERRVIAQLLSLLEGLERDDNIIVLAETNKLKNIDKAFRRHGIIDREIKLKLPNCQGRIEILKIHTRGVPLDEDVDIKVIAEKTKGFVGAELKALVNEAAILAMRLIQPQFDNENPIPNDVLPKLKIRMKHFFSAIDNMKPSTSN